MEVELFKYEENESTLICGTDEAGRGPLAGPVVVASVILPPSFPVSLLNDSKKMNEKEREEVEKIIKEKAVSYSIKRIPHTVIDKINILNASLRGMKLSSEEIYDSHPFSILLCDGNKIPNVSFPVEAVVKGDAKVHEIMAASILAKTERDRIMRLASLKWPQYGFERHKGYPTAEHYQAIEKYGPSPIHRMSFRLYREKEEKSEPTLF